MTNAREASAGSMPDLAGVKPVANFPKQAVVVIHGMGEQMPMDTIKGFVRAVWETDAIVTATGLAGASEVWSKPDLRTGSLELRRITTRPSITTETFSKGVRSDFYELYWADLSGGSTWSEVEGWIAGLLWRNPFTRVPRDVRVAWLFLWTVAIAVAVLAIATALPREASFGAIHFWNWPPLSWLSELQTWHLAALTVIGGFAIHNFLVPYFGRVVRYTRAKPENIAARKDIRERGLALLDQLHGGEYERVILVGHSLGSIVAYDLISYFWATRPESHTIDVRTRDEFDALRELEASIAAVDRSLGETDSVAQFRDAQRRLCHLLRLRSNPKARWLITDLITLGSPLTHAEFLLAKSKADLDLRKNGREFPTSPPVRETLDPDVTSRARQHGLPLETALCCFPSDANHWQLHHAAPFGAVRWTNIHDPARLVFCGDLISGPLAPAFGTGIIDIDLRKLRGQSWTFTHTRYWELERDGSTPCQVVALRDTLDLAGRAPL